MRVVRPGRRRAQAYEEGLQHGNLVIGARDGRFAGDPRHRSLRVRLLAVYPSFGAQRQGHRSGADRPGGRPGGHRPGLGPPVPRHDRAPAAGLLPAAPRAVAVQPPPAAPDAADHARAARPRRAHRRRPRAPRRRHPALLRQLRRLRGQGASSPATPPTATAPPRAAGSGACACCSSATATGRRSATTCGPPTRTSARASSPSPARTPAACSSPTPVIAAVSTRESLQLVGVELIVPDRHRLGERPPAEVKKARIRLVIESVFATLKRQMRLEDHLAKTLPGLAQRIVQRLLALDARHVPQQPPRAPTARACRLRRALNPHQASRRPGPWPGRGRRPFHVKHEKDRGPRGAPGLVPVVLSRRSADAGHSVSGAYAFRPTGSGLPAPVA